MRSNLNTKSRLFVVETILFDNSSGMQINYSTLSDSAGDAVIKLLTTQTKHRAEIYKIESVKQQKKIYKVTVSIKNLSKEKTIRAFIVNTELTPENKEPVILLKTL